MPTIKKTGIGSELRIITKVVNAERRVSCSCCEEAGCCPYPAQGLLDGLYTENDLPDEIEVYINNNLDYGLASRSGSEYVWTFNNDGVEQAYKIKINTEVIFDYGVAWSLEVDGDWTNGPEVCPCLFGVCYPEWGVNDTFADTYYWDNVATGDVSRGSVCSWAGGGARLDYYDGNNSDVEFYYNGPPHRWIFRRLFLQQDEGGGVWEKDDPQNGPAGTYSPSSNVTGNTFAGIGVVTVS